MFIWGTIINPFANVAEVVLDKDNILEVEGRVVPDGNLLNAGHITEWERGNQAE